MKTQEEDAKRCMVKKQAPKLSKKLVSSMMKAIKAEMKYSPSIQLGEAKFSTSLESVGRDSFQALLVVLGQSMSNITNLSVINIENIEGVLNRQVNFTTMHTHTALAFVHSLADSFC